MSDDLFELGDHAFLDPQALIEDRLLVNANSGGGKSRTLRKIIELMFGHAQIIVFDVEGEFHTLREKFGFALCGPGGEAPATVGSAPKLAERLLKLGKSVVIDISDLPPAQQEAYIAAFLSTWMRAARADWHDTVFILDEVNKFCPEGRTDPKSPLGMCQEAIVDLMRRGRKRGFGSVLATQRIADLNKRAAAECNSVMLGRVAVDVDIDRSAKALGMRKSDAAEKLPQLRPGEFFVYGRAVLGPESGDGQRVSRVKVGDVVTTHPKRGQRIPVTPPSSAVKRAFAELADIVEETEAEEREVERLRARVAELERNVDTGHAAVASAELDTLREQLAAVQAAGASAERESVERGKTITALVHALRDLVERHTIPAGATSVTVLAPPTPVPVPRSRRAATVPIPAPAPTRPHANGASRAMPSSTIGVNGTKVTAAHQRILGVLVQQGPLHPKKLAIRSGYTTAQKGFTNYLSEMRTRGLIVGRDPIEVTPAGRKAAGPVQPLPTGRDLLNHWVGQLPPALGRILTVIYNHHPRQPSPETVAREAGYDPSQKGFSNYLSELRTRGLIAGTTTLHTPADMH